MFYFYLSASWNNPDYGRCNNPFYFGADTRSAGCYFYDYAKNFNFNSNPKQKESFFSRNCQIVYLVRHWIKSSQTLTDASGITPTLMQLRSTHLRD